MTDNPDDARVCPRLRRALAWPVYVIALVLSFLSDALGNLAREDRRRRLNAVRVRSLPAWVR